jgi:GntR family histidine utilization transcriptional repressor
MPKQPSPDKTTFRDVKTEILRRITDGPWGPGSLLPGEIELAEEFGCSRTTLNRAMRDIAELGLIERRRKAGTRVRMAPIRQARFAIPLVRAEIENSGAIYNYRLVRCEPAGAPDWLSEKLKIQPGIKVVHVICVHEADGQAYQLEDRWINSTALPQALDQSFREIGPNEWLVATVPFSQVEISFSAVPAGAAIVRHLEYQPGQPVFCVERTTWWQGAAITHVTLSYRRGHRMTTRY